MYSCGGSKVWSNGPNKPQTQPQFAMHDLHLHSKLFHRWSIGNATACSTCLDKFHEADMKHIQE